MYHFLQAVWHWVHAVSLWFSWEAAVGFHRETWYTYRYTTGSLCFYLIKWAYYWCVSHYFSVLSLEKKRCTRCPLEDFLVETSCRLGSSHSCACRCCGSCFWMDSCVLLVNPWFELMFGRHSSCCFMGYTRANGNICTSPIAAVPSHANSCSQNNRIRYSATLWHQKTILAMVKKKPHWNTLTSSGKGCLFFLAVCFTTITVEKSLCGYPLSSESTICVCYALAK